MLKYFSVCSGIESATVAWKSLGWEPIGFSEIAPFPCAVLKHHYPNVYNFGDIKNYNKWEIKDATDIVVAGTPCQSFSLGGERKGLDDERGELAIKFFEIVQRLNPKWIIWENVHGVLSSGKGKDFGFFLSKMGECGYGFAYRIFDSQYFGIPQRRRRLFVIGYRGDWRPSAAVLFDKESLRRDSAKSRKKRQRIASIVEKSIGDSLPKTVGTICADTHSGAYSGQDAYTGRIIPHNGNSVRRLTVRECERLQGFPDDYSLISWKKRPPEECPDGPRLKAIGNSIPVPVMNWIGRRIDAVCKLI